MADINHNVNMANIAGGSERLEIKRARLWEELDEDQRLRVLESYEFVHFERDEIAPFAAMYDARERVLYAVYMAGYPRSAFELRYLLMVRWVNNIDIDTIRARLAQMATSEVLRPTANACFAVTEQGIDELKDITERWVRQEKRSIRQKHTGQYESLTNKKHYSNKFSSGMKRRYERADRN